MDDQTRADLQTLESRINDLTGMVVTLAEAIEALAAGNSGAAVRLASGARSAARRA